MKQLGVALCLLVAGCALAQTRVDARAQPELAGPPTRQLPVCTLAADDPTRLAVEPCRPAPPRQGLPRRAVPQAIERMPAPAPPVAAYPLRPPPVVPAMPRTPLPLGGCDVGGCRDANGVRHNGGVGNVTLDPGGRPCVRNGAWLQCP